MLSNFTSRREEDSMNNEPTLSGKLIVGIINPPPDVRTIVDKTAGFVARNGIDFENKIREKEAANARFNFLNPADPYHAYYRKKVQDFQEGKQETPNVHLPETVKEAVKKAEFVPQNPPPAFEFSHDPTTINCYELELIHLTAMFVARNGRQFLTQLMTREARNAQFDFLKPIHSSFNYFTKLVEQYAKIIVPPSNIIHTLEEETKNKKKLLEDIKYRVAWEKHQKNLKDKEDAEVEKEKMAYAQIDWHDFVVVQTVDFPMGDNSLLPPLCTPKDVGSRILLEQRSEQQKQHDQAEEMDMDQSDSDDERDIRQEVEQPAFAAPFPPIKQKDVIVRDYNPKKAAQAKAKQTEKWLISPLTGERIPSDKLDEHVRYNTVDSQYKEDRERHLGERISDEPVLALGADISKNLGQFAERRTDIFGVGSAATEQTAIGRKMGEQQTQQPTNKLIWDGTEESREAITKAVQNKVTIEEQISELHRQHGFVSDPRKEKIGAQQPQKQGYPFGGNDGPPSKRQKSEEDLVPEDIWLQKISGHVEVMLQMPDAPEYKMNGAIVPLTVDITMPIGEVKQIILSKYNVPTSKQKLFADGLFLKDNNSGAFYNLGHRSLLILQV